MLRLSRQHCSCLHPGLFAPQGSACSGAFRLLIKPGLLVHPWSLKERDRQALLVSLPMLPPLRGRHTEAAPATSFVLQLQRCAGLPSNHGSGLWWQ